MEIRKRKETDCLAAISRVYEESWRAAYQGLLPQAYLDAIPAGYWVPYLQQAGRECLLLQQLFTGCSFKQPEGDL